MKNYEYGIRLTIIYAMVWFIDLLDASTLNVALPRIADSFGITATDAEWAIIGFLLAMTLGMTVSTWMGRTFGMKRVFLLSQVLYIGSSLGCGLAADNAQLIFFRLLQGCSGGLIIPLGMATLLQVMPQKEWAKTSARMNMVTLLAPALGPLFAGYVTASMGWQWLFFLKLPLSFFCLLLSFLWVKETEKFLSRFDWKGFAFSGLSLSLFLLVFSEVGRPDFSTATLIILALFALIFGFLFLRSEKKTEAPLISLGLFRSPLFAFGNIIQSSANVIFLGSNFIIALYLQKGLGFDIVTTGWVMAAITPGMLLVQPLVGKFYNRLGPLPFILPGLIVLALVMFAFMFVTSKTPPILLALLIFLEGAASSMLQTANVTSIFAEVPEKQMGAGSSLYSLFKQISASFGVALSTMVLSISSFPLVFLVLGMIPLLALICCRHIDNKKALKKMKQPHTETEFGAE